MIYKKISYCCIQCEKVIDISKEDYTINEIATYNKHVKTNIYSYFLCSNCFKLPYFLCTDEYKKNNIYADVSIPTIATQSDGP